MIQELEASITHRFVNLTHLLSQRTFGKNFIVEHVFWTHLQMIVRCQFNYIVLDDPMAKNRYVKGINTFLGADKMIHKIAYF